MRPSLLVLGIGLLPFLSPTANALAPTDDVYVGIEPQRIRHVHAQAQAAYLRSDAWRDFTAQTPGQWQARFDELTGVPRRIWGSGYELGRLPDSMAAGDAVIQFIRDNKNLFKVEPGSLRVRSASYVDRTNQWFVDVDVLVHGYPQYRGGFTARITDNRLLSIGADHYPDARVDARQEVSADEAIVTAIQQGPAADAFHDFITTQLVMLPIDVDGEWQLKLVWQVESETFTPPGRWVAFVDASANELLHVYNQVRFFEGSLSAYHDTRTVDGNMSWSPLPHLRISNGSDIATADSDGLFQIDDGDAYTSTFNGEFFNIINTLGSTEFTLDSTKVELTDADADQAEIDSYIFLNQVREWGAEYAPEVLYTRFKLASYVNIDSVCNAYYNGDLNFFRAGNGCNNTGRIADVNYHEWGHGFHEWSIESGSFDGSLSEGAADTISFLQTNDNRLAPYFQTNGSWLRDVENQQRYPDDYVNSADYVHYNGLIFGGSMWDFKNIVAARTDDETAIAVTSAVLAGLLKGGPTVETAFDEALVADDDDADLSNGTPNECDLIEAFGLHGLGPLGASDAVIAGHEPLDSQSADQDHDIYINLVNPAPNCFDYVVTDAIVTWRVNGGEWQNTDLIVFNDTDEIIGAIPQQQLGDFVEYFLTVENENGSNMLAPTGTYINPYSFYVGDVIEITCSDFEDNNGGFTHELVSGEETEGADDWQWGVPRGAYGDPAKAHSGSGVWGNDLGYDNYNGAYQNEKHNRLTSPVYDLGHHEGAFLHYYRWLTVEDGYYDHASILADGEQVWTNWGTGQDGVDHHIDDQWMAHAVDIGGQTDDRQVQLSWDIETDQGLYFGGWNIDDVCIFSPATANNRLGITNFTASKGLDREIQLNWTNPSYAPLERVVVIRNAAMYPQGPTSGSIIYDERSPVLGGAVAISDIEVANSYYAVYAHDGTEWLTWTQEGWNADYGSATGMITPGTSGGTTSGCACASTTAPFTGWLVGFPALLLACGLRRRRDGAMVLD